MFILPLNYMAQCRKALNFHSGQSAVAGCCGKVGVAIGASTTFRLFI